MHEQFEDARVLTVVAGAEADDIILARWRHTVLVYDESMERVAPECGHLFWLRLAPTDPIAAEAISIAEDRTWSDVEEWEFGPDALRDPWLYADAEEEPTGEDSVDDGYELVDEDGWRPGRGAGDR